MFYYSVVFIKPSIAIEIQINCICNLVSDREPEQTDSQKHDHDDIETRLFDCLIKMNFEIFCGKLMSSHIRFIWKWVCYGFHR